MGWWWWRLLLGACRYERTDDERNHGSSVTTGLFQALDELLDLPYFDVLLGLVRLLLFTHVGGASVVRAWWDQGLRGGLSVDIQNTFFQGCGGARGTVAPAPAGAGKAETMQGG